MRRGERELKRNETCKNSQRLRQIGVKENSEAKRLQYSVEKKFGKFVIAFKHKDAKDSIHTLKRLERL